MSKERLFRDFESFYPGKFLNITNGITQRRWLLQANTDLSRFITAGIGCDWTRDLYELKKLTIKLINDIAVRVNSDQDVRDRLKVIFLPDYRVSQAEKIVAAADFSQQISTAGMEASGTINMKFALNGPFIIGNLDGTNIEIMEEVGADNMFIFGLMNEEIGRMRSEGYNPWDCYRRDAELAHALDMIASGYFSPEDRDRYLPITRSLLDHGGDISVESTTGNGSCFRVTLSLQHAAYEDSMQAGVPLS